MTATSTSIASRAAPMAGTIPVRWTAIALATLKKLAPHVQWRNPVMFVVYIGSIVTTLLWIQAVRGEGEAPAGFIFAVVFWLWFTVLFANAAEALAEGRGKAQADALRSTRQRVLAKVLNEPRHGTSWHNTPRAPSAARRRMRSRSPSCWWR